MTRGVDFPRHIRMNRRLSGAKARPFHNTYPDWEGNGEVKLSGKEVMFGDVFIGFGDVAALKRLLGKDAERVLSKLKVGVYKGMGYAWVDEDRFRLMISKSYLEKGSRTDIYLDVLHELVHIKQHMNGMDLWDERYDYVDRPTEMEAYRFAVREGSRMGLNKKELRKHLHNFRLTKDQNERLRRACGI